MIEAYRITSDTSGTSHIFTGPCTFSSLPICTIAPTTGSNLVNKTYADALVTPYLTTASATSTYQPISSMSNYLTTANATSTYQPISSMSNYLTTANATSTYQPISSMSNYLTTANATSTYQPISAMSTYATKNNQNTFTASQLVQIANTGAISTNLLLRNYTEQWNANSGVRLAMCVNKATDLTSSFGFEIVYQSESSASSILQFLIGRSGGSGTNTELSRYSFNPSAITGTLNGNLTYTGACVFNQVVTASVAPSTANHLTNKKYVDDRFTTYDQGVVSAFTNVANSITAINSQLTTLLVNKLSKMIRTRFSGNISSLTLSPDSMSSNDTYIYRITLVLTNPGTTSGNQNNMIMIIPSSKWNCNDSVVSAVGAGNIKYYCLEFYNYLETGMGTFLSNCNFGVCTRNALPDTVGGNSQYGSYDSYGNYCFMFGINFTNITNNFTIREGNQNNAYNNYGGTTFTSNQNASLRFFIGVYNQGSITMAVTYGTNLGTHTIDGAVLGSVSGRNMAIGNANFDSKLPIYPCINFNDINQIKDGSIRILRNIPTNELPKTIIGNNPINVFDDFEF
jgi:hypothetical protein